MRIGDMHRELGLIQVRTRRSLGLSIIAHLLLFLLTSLYHAVAPEPLGITEITWIEPVEAAPLEPAPVLVRNEPTPAADRAMPVPPSPASEKFQRAEEVADIAPRPQTLKRVDTSISDRLASLQKTSRPTPKPIVAVETPSPVGRPKLADVSDNPVRAQPEDLKRSAQPSTPSPVTLKRSRPTRVQRAAVPTALPDFEADRAVPDRVDTSAQARRTLAGAQMAGPVADRPIVSYNTPVFPEWAKREGVEGSVMIYFIVLPDGTVKKNVMVQKTSGFAEFDENAMKAILTWRFEPLKAGQTGEQWGTITFHYRLSDAP